ncbi:hypothetical protein Xen7305DRAFT_00024850 [Xenococcus sp. PCC 7305]|uniref:hypothetical protein n=1 Tax=Xenococcus sp. PCC 7305 TaxID=102125 RepID=UPI0002AC758F|nr:hypothetical protein [Xenococcus sp. PCC 7305]ELS02767.1 hypothetical protein Xen7305DRAFT_00024850 [Xenococcus sp. PCC 7305]
MKKLFLHIGLHKTGTTTLQRFLLRNRSNLRNSGYLYPQIGIPGKLAAQHNLGWLTINSKKANPAFGTWKEVHEEIDNSSLDNIIISAESFGLANRKAIKILKSELKFYDVKIIVYLRRQDRILESQYIQHLKMGILPKSDLDDILFFIKKNKVKYDYYKLLEPWKQEFGISNIIVRPLEKFQIPSTHYDLLKIVGVNDFSHFNNVENKNVKPGIKALSALKIISKIYESQPQKKKECLRIIVNLAEKYWSEEKKISYRLLSYLDASKILNWYKQSNLAVAQEYLERKDGVLFYEQLESYKNYNFDVKDLSQEELLGLIQVIIGTERGAS